MQMGGVSVVQRPSGQGFPPQPGVNGEFFALIHLI